VWIAEVMLQQTQVKTMLPYYRRWMERFPDVTSLAAASVDDVTRLWEGLGYYARAHRLLEAARVLVRDHGGRLPPDLQQLMALPGIGRYTAGAILSLAFNEPVPAVDGNLERVLARFFNRGGPMKEPGNQRFLWETARDWIPAGTARHFNQALMELGATVCLPRRPLCDACPVRRECVSRRLGVVEQRPERLPPRRITGLQVALGIVFSHGRLFIQKRPATGLMPNLWEFPGGKLERGETPEQGLVREFREELGWRVTLERKIAVIRHSYTSFRVTLHCFLCTLRSTPETAHPATAAATRWVDPRDLSDYAFPAANRRLIRMLAAKNLLETHGEYPSSP
jgi:A/G-specific adenine glycosylase